MKKITLILAACMIGAVSFAQTTLSHSESQVPVEGSVACANGPDFSTENNFWRSYTPADFGESGTISIEGGEMGVSVTDRGGMDPTFAIVVNAYSTDDEFPLGVLTLIATSTSDVNMTDDLTVISFDFETPVNIDSGDEIVLEMRIPTGEIDLFDCRIAQNADPETAPTYISTDVSCGPLPITSFDDLGFPGSGILNLVVGDEILGVNDVLLGSVSVYPNPATDVLNIQVPASVEINNALLYDILGKRVSTSVSNGQINVANLSKGVYMLSVETTVGTLTEKVIIE